MINTMTFFFCYEFMVSQNFDENLEKQNKMLLVSIFHTNFENNIKIQQITRNN